MVGFLTDARTQRQRRVVLATTLLASLGCGDAAAPSGETGDGSSETSSSTTSMADASTGGGTTGGGSTGGSSDETTGTEDGSSSGGVFPPPGCTGEEAKTIFLNFGGVTLVPGPDSAQDNTSNLFPEEVMLEPYSRDDAADVFATVQDHWSPFDVCVTDQRPGRGDYTMVVLTPSGALPGAPSVGAIDCGDAAPSQITVVFEGPPGVVPTGDIARTASATVGSSYGLGIHDVDPADVMCGDPGQACDNGGEPRSFKDECIVLFDPGDGVPCPEQHTMHCLPGQGNSFAELTTIVGAAG